MPVSLFESGELDLVHICTPPQSHVLLALQAQKAGVAALVEKPIALSLREMDLARRCPSGKPAFRY